MSSYHLLSIFNFQMCATHGSTLTAFKNREVQCKSSLLFGSHVLTRFIKIHNIRSWEKICSEQHKHLSHHWSSRTSLIILLVWVGSNFHLCKAHVCELSWAIRSILCSYIAKLCTQSRCLATQIVFKALPKRNHRCQKVSSQFSANMLGLQLLYPPDEVSLLQAAITLLKRDFVRTLSNKETIRCPPHPIQTRSSSSPSLSTS